MDLHTARLVEYQAGILFVDASAWQDDKSVTSLLLQLFQQRNALLCLGLLARGQNTAAAYSDDLLEGCLRVSADVKGPMEGDGLALCGCYETVRGL